jgi:hypothetical protein
MCTYIYIYNIAYLISESEVKDFNFNSFFFVSNEISEAIGKEI